MGALNPDAESEIQVPTLPARVAWTAIGLIWVVSALLIIWGAYQLREQARRQVVDQYAAVFTALAGPNRETDGVADEGSVVDGLQLFSSLARATNILAARLYTGKGEFQLSIPALVSEGSIPDEALAKVRQMQTSSRFEPEYSLAEAFLAPDGWPYAAAAQEIPVVEVFVPLVPGPSRSPDGGPTDIAWFLLEGSSVQDEFRRFDVRLLLQVVLQLGVAFTVTGGALHWSFRRLARTQALLMARTEELLRVNRELSQSVRVAAVGAVTAHLMHGLKSPMSGLTRFMAARVQSDGGKSEGWVEALAATRRMQSMIQGVSRVVGEQSAEYTYHVTPRELAESIAQKVRPLADAGQVRFSVEGDPAGRLENRTAGLLGLLLTNLVENALQASPPGEEVVMKLSSGTGWEFEIVDHGPGLVPEVLGRLFEPQRSTKEGGSGLGLAITRQLAMALGGSVRLMNTGPGGTAFRVDIPFAAQKPESAEGGTEAVAEVT